MAEKNTRKSLAESFLGKTVRILIDRPIGSVYPKYKDMIFPINYGFIPNVWSEDGEELDVYLLGVNKPKKQYKADKKFLLSDKLCNTIKIIWCNFLWLVLRISKFGPEQRGSLLPQKSI